MKQKGSLAYCLIALVGTFAFACMMSACHNERPDSGHYYAIDSLVKAQVTFLPTVKASVTKTTVFNDKTASITFTPGDTALWAKELEIFRELKEINKPINVGHYTVEDGLLDTQSNLKVKLFSGTAKDEVVWLKVYYHKTISRLRKIEALMNRQNDLYKSTRLLTMDFQELNNNTVLTAYTIEGGQKMLTADSVRYSVSGKIKIY